MKIRIKILSLLLALGFNNCSLKSKKQEYAEMLIEKVESFKEKNNRLPKNTTELGLTEFMNSPAFYQVENDSTYTIWYGLSLGESKTYKSSTKKWTKGG